MKKTDLVCRKCFSFVGKGFFCKKCGQVLVHSELGEIVINNTLLVEVEKSWIFGKKKVVSIEWR